MAPIRELRRAKFSLEMLEDISFEGFTAGDSWNGWDCPYFARETTERVLKASEKNNYRWSYDDKSDSFLVKHIDDPDDFEAEKFGGISIMVDGHKTMVYAVGAYSWTWEIC